MSAAKKKTDPPWAEEGAQALGMVLPLLRDLSREGIARVLAASAAFYEVEDEVRQALRDRRGVRG